jgi:hypothetical protein
MASKEPTLENLGDGILIGARNRDGHVTISDAETGATLGRAFGATGDALNADIARKVALIREQRAAVAAVAKAEVEDMEAGRTKLLAQLRSKATPTPTPTQEVTEGPNNG